MNQNIDSLCLMKECSATQGRCLWGPRFKIWKKYLYKLFIAIHFAKANVDLDTDRGLLWHQVAVFYAVMIAGFSTCDNCPMAGLPDHALVEDQSEDIAADVKFSVWRLETQTVTGLASQVMQTERQGPHASAQVWLGSHDFLRAVIAE